MTESEIISWMDKLSEKQFIDFFYRSVKNRGERGAQGYISHLVLAEAANFLDEKDKWELLILCEEDKKSSVRWDDEAIVCQSGECCGHETMSYAKEAICAICGKDVYGS